MKKQILKNDRLKQFVIRVTEKGIRYDLYLPPLSQSEYLSALDEGKKYRESLKTNLKDHEYTEIYIDCDVTGLDSWPEFVKDLKCTGWTGIGNEPIQLQKGGQKEMIL